MIKKDEKRRIPVPPHRMTPLRNHWEKIVTTVVVNNSHFSFSQMNILGKYEVTNKNEHKEEVC